MTSYSTAFGTSELYSTASLGSQVTRFNSGTSMVDVLPGINAGAMVGNTLSINNADTTAELIITPGIDTSINGVDSFTLPPMTTVNFTWNGLEWTCPTSPLTIPSTSNFTYDYFGTNLIVTAVDANLNNLVATDPELSLPMRPGPKLITAAQLATPTWNMTLHWGQSLACGVHGYPAYSVTTHGHMTFGSGPKSMSPTNIFGLTYTTTPGTTTVKTLAEDNQYAWAPDDPTNINAGESSITQSLEHLSALATAFNPAITDANNTWFGSSPARGGEQIVTLTPSGTDWTTVADHMNGFVTNARAAGRTPIVRDMTYTQGQADLVIGTGYAAYLADFLQIIAGADAYAQQITGQTKPVILFVNQTSHVVTTDNGQVAQAQLDATFMDPRCKLLIPDYFLPHYMDRLHLINDGYALRGVYEGRAKFWTFFRDGISAVCGIRPLVTRWKEGRFYSTFEVPTPPLVFSLADINTANPNWAATFQSGFRAYDSVSDIALSDFAIEADGVTVSCAGSRAPVGATTFRGGMDYFSTSGPTGAPGGANTDVKDSTVQLIPLNGQVYNSWYPVPHYGATVMVEAT